jgi:anthranilate synthase component 1
MAGQAAAYSIYELPYDPSLALRLHRHDPVHYPFLLESAASGTAQGRFDILFAGPTERLVLDCDRRLDGPGASSGPDFLAALNGWWQRESVERCAGDSPFRGGWFLYLGYELAGEVESTLDLHRPAGLPMAAAVRVRAAAVLDRHARRAWVVAERGAEAAGGRVLRDAAALDPGDPVAREGPLLTGRVAEEPAERYVEAVRRVKDYIAAGDIFQANLSRLWSARLAENATPLELYLRLRESNPGPFAGLLCWDDQAVVSSSPERLLRLCDGIAETRPIAGTRPRAVDAGADRALSAELIRHPKERAEHIMLIDLERNDLGRVCVPGTVEVDELMVIESYAHVHHIVSNVRGRLRADVLPADAIRAVFPGGTITGCPKVRCMEIIDELEQAPRGPYTGAMGYLNRDGSLDLNILIRTLHVDGRELRFRAGGGIVADSEPGAEVAETRAKARGLLLALEERRAPC